MLSQSFAFVRLSLDLPGAHGQQRLSSIMLGSAIFVDAEHQWPLTDPLIVEAPYRERLPNAVRWRPTGRRLSP